MTTTIQDQAWQVQEQMKELRHEPLCNTRIHRKGLDHDVCTCDYPQRFERLNNAAQSLMAFKMKQEKFERMERAMGLFCKRAETLNKRQDEENWLDELDLFLQATLADFEPLISKLKSEEEPKEPASTHRKEGPIDEPVQEPPSQTTLDKYRHDLYFPIELKYERRGSRYAYFTTGEDILMDLEDQGSSAMMFMVLLLGKLETGEYALVSSKRLT